ncbi:DUF1553 domain-containing protein [Singulisphaera sp. PoT]|uniref:DUF1553 domain-containing protein n=1 Tax=Singulisphaera sp. PoT TaxID=3411797 RepID=UPI003BF5216C
MTRTPLRNLVLCLGAYCASAGSGSAFGQEAAPAPAPSPEQVQFFESRIRPTLVTHCTKCHGEEKQKGGLRVDSRTAMIEGGDSGAAIVPGNPEESLLVGAINHGDDGPKMPPSKKLAARDIADLTQWIKIGAPWPGDHGAAAAPRKAEFKIGDKERAHWAFQPIHSPPLPAVKDAAWVANPIDAFVLAKLEAKDLKPNAPASRRELIRRAYYDLTGLPPTPEEVAAFEADQSPRAYEDLIDRLLSSARYGEKWGRYWLDLVRYAETNSYERDNPKPNAWRYRDYVIRSFNDDKPYDRFVKEQIAGDELPDRTNDALIATGYYRLGIWDDEPTDRVQARYDSLDDVVATTGQVFLGLTIDCARCHDHKLDPIPQKDYYRLLSFFHNVQPYRNGGPTDEVAIFANQAAREQFEASVKETQARRDAMQVEVAGIEQAFRTAYQQEKAKAIATVDLDDLHFRYYRDTWEKLPDFATLKPEDVGTMPKPYFDLGPRTRDDAFGFVFEGVLIVPKDGEYTFFLDSDDGSRLKVAGKTVVEHDGLHEVGREQKGTVTLSQGRLPIQLEYFQKSNAMGLSVAWSGPGFERRSLSAPKVAQAEGDDVVQLMRSEGKRLLGADRMARYQTLRRELKSLSQETAAPERALCVTESGTTAPDTFVLLRGNAHVQGDKVEPAFLEVLGNATPVIPQPPQGATTSGRRSVLADWMVSAENPLTARVMANRVWQYHFGRGIVRSSSNFGMQGDRPTHPELLDWLAAEFLKQGWHLKSLHRTIMTSNTYRMSSKANAEALAQDPINDLMWRFDMRRLSAEEIRDSILAATGSLNLKMYGPGIYPEIPAEVMAGQSVPGAGWGKSPPEEQVRRSIYIHVKRSLLTPILESFDLAETDRSTPVRFATTQPTQALAMLNGAFLNQQAARMGERVRREAGEKVEDQVALALKLVTTRVPTQAEINRGLALVEYLEKQEGASAKNAVDSFCLLALNLNEFVYLD